MNMAQVVMENGRLDYEASRVALEPAEIPQLRMPQVTVREWHGRTQRHEVLYSGPMRLADISALVPAPGARTLD